MKNAFFLYCTISLLACFWTSCENRISKTYTKALPADPFKETMDESQFFTVYGDSEQLIEGKYGTRIFIPEESVLDPSGDPFEGEYQIEITEVNSIGGAILSNLTTTSNGQPLQSEGMLFINATAGETALHINPDRPIYIEIPTKKRIAGMMVYQGERDQDGNTNWIDPKPIIQNLFAVPLSGLDFLPPGFAETVAKNLPFEKHRVATNQLIDSLYYSLSLEMIEELTADFAATNAWEPNGIYDPSAPLNDTAESLLASHPESVQRDIDPRQIQTLKDPNFNNTLIATREFQARLQAIFKSCQPQLLDLYINHLDKNLWEIDQMAADASQGEVKETFENFATQKCTRVKNSGHIAKRLMQYYQQKLVHNKLLQARMEKKVTQKLELQNQKAKNILSHYKEVLADRESQRMAYYGFERCEMGWINIDRGTVEKNWEYAQIRVALQPHRPIPKMDRLYAYVWTSGVNTIQRLQETEGQSFVGKSMPLAKNQQSDIIVVGYRNDTLFYRSKSLADQSQETVIRYLYQADVESFRRWNAKFYGEKINQDLEYQALFAKEKKRQEKLRNEKRFLRFLAEKAFPCSTDFENLDGEALFRSNCRSCHTAGKYKMVGPSLVGATARLDMETWLIPFTRDSQAFVEQTGDAYAKRVIDEYNGSLMPASNLSDAQIRAIYEYIDRLNETDLH